MPLTIIRGGDLLGSRADGLVNTINCRGPMGPAQASMGKGLALQFAHRYPEMIPAYKKVCLAGTLQPGMIWPFRVHGHEAGTHQLVLNCATKDDWSQPSRLEWIVAILQRFVANYERLGIRSVAFPPLGCGNGGLSWHKEVSPLVEQYLSALPIRVELYLPHVF